MLSKANPPLIYTKLLQEKINSGQEITQGLIVHHPSLSIVPGQHWVSAANFIGEVYKEAFVVGVAGAVWVKDCNVPGSYVSGLS